MRTSVALCVATLLAGGCEKAGPTASGKLSDDEAALMSRLPHDQGIVFGGNLPRLQRDLANSPIMKFARIGNEMVKGTNAWQDCLANKPFKHMMGTVDARSGFEMRFLMTGLEMDDLEECAKTAGMKFQLDPDKKFIAIELDGPGFKTKLPYLVLADGAIYGKYSVGLALAGAPRFDESGRARMEADIEATKKNNATQNTELLATMERADRKKGMWFAGTGKGTLVGDQVHEFYGAMDLEGGLEVDATLQMASKKVANQVMDSIDQMNDAAGLLGSELKAVLKALEVKRDGEHIRFTLKVSNAQLEALYSTFGSMMGAGGSRARPQWDAEAED